MRSLLSFRASHFVHPRIPGSDVEMDSSHAVCALGDWEPPLSDLYTRPRGSTHGPWHRQVAQCSKRHTSLFSTCSPHLSSGGRHRVRYHASGFAAPWPLKLVCRRNSSPVPSTSCTGISLSLSPLAPPASCRSAGKLPRPKSQISVPEARTVRAPHETRTGESARLDLWITCRSAGVICHVMEADRSHTISIDTRSCSLLNHY